MSNVLLLVQSACTEGFMDLSLLERKASDIGNSQTNGVWDLADFQTGNAKKWFINNIFTSCNTATLTGFFIGVDIRTEFDDRNEYPKIEIWKKDGDKHYKKYSPETSVTINLSPENFTTSGLYQYILQTGILVKENDRLIVYQPAQVNSVVRFFYTMTDEQNDWIGKFDNIYQNKIKVKGNNKDVSKFSYKILLEPILGM